MLTSLTCVNKKVDVISVPILGKSAVSLELSRPLMGVIVERLSSIEIYEYIH